jgi:succinate dehydrogenase / fumarate reductase iron-sulfur subunit
MTQQRSGKWNVNFRVFRFKRDAGLPRYDTFLLEIGPDETVLDGLEKIWAFQDRSLAFRHACHHASCGTCGMRINGMEKLACIVAIHEVTRDGGTVLCEPLRSFPLVSDLVVDVGQFFRKLEQADFEIIRNAEPLQHAQEEVLTRFGLCVSACPVAASDELYLGPAALAASWRMVEEPRSADVPRVLANTDQEHGCWRCHAAFECSEVCPSNVDPAAGIMALRRELLKRKLFGRSTNAR